MNTPSPPRTRIDGTPGSVAAGQGKGLVGIAFAPKSAIMSIRLAGMTGRAKGFQVGEAVRSALGAGKDMIGVA